MDMPTFRLVIVAFRSFDTTDDIHAKPAEPKFSYFSLKSHGAGRTRWSLSHMPLSSFVAVLSV
jgi:hypothetical protein